MSDWRNQLYFDDNLHVLCTYIKDKSVALVCLDPPSNSNAAYNIIYKEKTGEKFPAQVIAFEDTWHWGEEAEKAYHELVTIAPKNLADSVQAFCSFLSTQDMTAYLVMLSLRLVELHRVLNSTESIYLHYDPTASQYL